MKSVQRSVPSDQPVPRGGSSLDVRFRLLGFPVCVRPGFWLIHAAAAGLMASDPDVTRGLGPVLVFLLTYCCTAGSVCLHELGHLMAGRWLGADGKMELTYSGGFAGIDLESHSRRRRILVLMAGPLVTFLLLATAGPAFFAFQSSGKESQPAAEQAAVAGNNRDQASSRPPPPLSQTALDHVLLGLAGVNLVLLLLNMMPNPSTDGGMIYKELHDWYYYGEEAEYELGPDGWKRV